MIILLSQKGHDLKSSRTMLLLQYEPSYYGLFHDDETEVERVLCRNQLLKCLINGSKHS